MKLAKPVYLKQLDPLCIFKVESPGGVKIYLSIGCKRIQRKEYDRYKKKGYQ